MKKFYLVREMDRLFLASTDLYNPDFLTAFGGEILATISSTDAKSLYKIINGKDC